MRRSDALVAASTRTLTVLALGITMPALAQYRADLANETRLSQEEQDRLNRDTRIAIRSLNVALLGAIPAGFINVPIWVGAVAETTQLAADTTLKFMPAVLVEPPDLARRPSSPDLCTFNLELPQSYAQYGNFLGLFPKFQYGPEAGFGREHVDRLFLPTDTPIDFGVLGVPEVLHANTDVDLSLLIHGAPGFVERSDVPQTVSLGAGTYTVQWTADTLYAPFWDTYLPAAMIPVMLAVEAKYGSYIDELAAPTKTARNKTADLISPNKRAPRYLAKQLEELNRKLFLYSLLKNLVPEGVDITTDFLVDKIANGDPNVSRSRLQQFTVYDVVAPTIETTVANPRLEATDIGGARSGRYLNQLESYIVATDACGRPIELTHDAPTMLPLGDTVVTWTVRDTGPVESNTDHDGDGLADADAFNSRTVEQVVTVEDTQAPILVPPPGVVIESASAIDLADQALGQPLVVDLADLHPTVASSSVGSGIVPPDTRAVVTWTAVDESANVSAGEQLVTVKTPGTNTAPVVTDRSANTLTSKPVDIVLTGADADALPLTGGGPSMVDPLQFKIEQLPQHGEFVAPLYPFFINDYRTDKVGGLVDYINSQPDAAALLASYEQAVATNSLAVWMNQEFCRAGIDAPVDFTFKPLFVQVTDDGEQYFFDEFLVCNPDVDSEWATYPRISRWDRNNEFLGATRIEDNGGGGVSDEVAFFRFDRSGFLYYVNNRTGGDPVVSVQRCSANLTDTSNDPPFCQGQTFFGPVKSDYTSNRSDPEGAYVDSARDIVYVTVAGAERRVDVFRLSTGPFSGPIGTLSNDAGVQDFLSNNGCRAFGSFYDAMETDSAGNFYVVDNDCHRIHKFTPSYIDEDGLPVIGTYVGWMGRCSGSNNLACDVPNGRTKGFSCTAAAQCTIPVDNTTPGPDSRGSLVGQFWNPSFLSIDPNDVLYVADYSNKRVQRFAPDGTFAGQAQSTGNGINAATDGSFVLGNMGPPKHVTVNTKNFFVVDQSENFVHVFDTSPFKDVTDSSATVSYVSNFDFHSATDTFAYSVDDGLVTSNRGTVSVAVARNYRQPLPTPQTAALDEDTRAVIVLSGSDPDGIVTRDFNGLDSLTFKITQHPEHGKLVRGGDPGDADLDPGTEVWTYVPNRDYHGTDAFEFTVRDAFTDETTDGATTIPDPYGEADPVEVSIDVRSRNDVPIVRIAAPERIAAGFPILLRANAYDDGGEGHAATLAWGDGKIDRDGKIVVDRNGTPNDSSDDRTSLTGVVYSADGLRMAGRTDLNALHTYTSTGNRTLTLCLRDGGRLETCDAIDVRVEALVALGTKVEASATKIVDGIPFTATIHVENSVPTGGVTGLDASDVRVEMEIPPELAFGGATASQGTCAINQGMLECSLGALDNGASATIDLALRGEGSLVYDEEASLLATVTTASDAVSDQSVGSALVTLQAVTNDRDSDGLPNIFEARHGVTDPAADDDGDGISNRRELDAGTSPSDADSDDDGIRDGVEIDTHDTDPLNADSDNDGIDDTAELGVHGTDPRAADTDGDGLPDQWELDAGFDPRAADADGDADQDGLTDADEYRYSADHLVADSDGDGLGDGAEVHVHDTDPANTDSDDDGFADDAELAAGTDPLKPDSDDDGLLDGAEVLTHSTDPLHPDTDRDALPDGWEVHNARNPLLPEALPDPDGDGVPTAPEVVAGTNPLDPDTDRDGLGDGAEGLAGTNPLDPDSDDDGVADGDERLVHSTDPRDADTDGDGLPDGWEVDNGSQPTVSDAGADGDGDGLRSLAEYEHGTDPRQADTDGDELADGAELRAIRYEDSGQLLGAATSEAVELGDLDGDGDLDAFVANRGSAHEIWINDGTGAFTRSVANTLNSIDAVDVVLLDFQGDGDLDALLAHPDPAQSSTLWRNDGTGVFVQVPFPLPPAASDGIAFGRVSPGPPGAEMGIFIANWGANQAASMLPSAFTAGQVADTLNGNSEDVALGDLDGDGYDDAFVVNRNQPAQVFRNLRSFPALFIDSGQRLGNDFAIAVDLGDVDADGDLDAYEVIFGAGDRVWLNAGNGVFTDSGQSLGSDGGNDVALVDVDADGYPDALVANTGPNRLWRNTLGTFTDSGITLGGGTTFGLAVGDLDGDGGNDVFFANDGPNTVWRLRRLDPLEPDTDGDGAFDGWELAHGFDPLDDADGALDSDSDGLSASEEFNADTDPRRADTDGDGMPDRFEVEHGLDPTTADSALDLEGDGLSNGAEHQQGLDPQADDVPPQLTVPPAVTTSSTGALTAVALGAASATDARDGARTATVDFAGPFPAGRNRVAWAASDRSGNVAQRFQTVDVIPLVSFGVGRRVAEGDTVDIVAMLNGSAVEYPVEVAYTVSGSAANPQDHDAASGIVVIESGDAGSFPIRVVRDFVYEGEETIVLSIDGATNAVPGAQDTQTITITQANVKPNARIVMTQNGRPVTTAAASSGPITVAAVVIDPNSNDTHAFDWSASDGGVFDPTRSREPTFVIDPATLVDGVYALALDITDNGTPIEMNRARALLRVARSPPTLSQTQDSDGDGMADAAEGAGDADSDRVPDHLDAGDSPRVLRYGDGYVLEAQPGLALRLGARAFELGNAAEVSEAAVGQEPAYGYPNGIADFEITGVEPGASARVVLPLRRPIPANAVYRKHKGAWGNLVIDAANSIASAPGGQGACPQPGDSAYVAGANAGHACLELVLQDGGPNDADGVPNGTIADPGGLAVAVGVRLEVLPASDRTVARGSARNVVLVLRLETESGDAQLESFTLTAFGSGDDRDVKGVGLYVDQNGDGVLDATEPTIGSGTFDRDNGELRLRMTNPYLLSPGRTNLFVTFDF